MTARSEFITASFAFNGSRHSSKMKGDELLRAGTVVVTRVSSARAARMAWKAGSQRASDGSNAPGERAGVGRLWKDTCQGHARQQRQASLAICELAMAAWRRPIRGHVLHTFHGAHEGANANGGGCVHTGSPNIIPLASLRR